jgi:hypothetical protein
MTLNKLNNFIKWSVATVSAAVTPVATVSLPVTVTVID